MRIRKITQNLFYYLLLLWVVIGVLSVTYNINKSFSEIKEWAPLSQDTKNRKLYGDSYSFYKFMRDNSSSGEIFLLTKDSMAFFLPRYLLYPNRIYWVKDQNDFFSRINQRKEGNYFVYDWPANLEGHTVVATYSGETHKKGFLIKK